MNNNMRLTDRAGSAPHDFSKVLVHVFLTSNYLEWGELFLEAFRYQHGEFARVRVDGIDLSEDDIEFLRRIYFNIEIYNTVVDWDGAAEQLGVDRETLDRWRWEVKCGDVHEGNFPAKVYISVHHRYRGLERVIREARDAGYEYVIHSDADVYARNRFDRLLGIMSENDFCLYMRPNKKRDVMKVWGGFLCFKTSGKIESFIENWMAEIDATPVAERWKGFGQSAIWYAIGKTPDLAIGDLTTHPDAPKYSDAIDDGDDIWLGNSTVVGDRKVMMLRRCWDDFRGRYPRIPLLEVTWSYRLNQIYLNLRSRLAHGWHRIRKRLKARLGA